jgi:dihydrofolate reductase
MRKLILKMSVSVDGFVGGPNGEIDWLLKSLDEETTAWIRKTLWQAGLHIMGSRTFYDMASYWPYSTDPLATPMNEIPKLVFSRKGIIEPVSEDLTTTAYKDSSHLDAEKGVKKLSGASTNISTWTNARVASGDLEKEIISLKKESGKDMLAHGGASFAQNLVKTGLIDEYQLVIHPAVLGSGLPLFSAIHKPIDLKLVSASSFKSGVVAHIYRPA